MTPVASDLVDVASEHARAWMEIWAHFLFAVVAALTAAAAIKKPSSLYMRTLIAGMVIFSVMHAVTMWHFFRVFYGILDLLEYSGVDRRDPSYMLVERLIPADPRLVFFSYLICAAVAVAALHFRDKWRDSGSTDYEQALDDVKGAFRKLKDAEAHQLATAELPKTPGIYVLSEMDGHCYVGRTGNLRKRLKQHTAAVPEQASLAVHIARLDAETPATSRPGGGARYLYRNNERFRAAFEAALQRIGAMQVRYVGFQEDEDDGLRQAMLEIYAAVEFRTRVREGGYNSFRNH